MTYAISSLDELRT